MPQGKIIVVDDEEIIRNLARDVLSDEGYEVTVCASASEALQQIKSANFDLLLSDIKMPEMDGIELIKNALAARPDTVAVIMTGYASIETARMALKEGAYDYMMKPFEVEEVRNAVKNALDRKRVSGENAKTRELMELSNVSELVSVTSDLDRTLSLILNTALNRTRSVRGSIMLLDETNRNLVIRVHEGLDESIVKNAKVPVGDGIAGWVARQAEPILVTDVKEHPLFSRLCRNYEDKSFVSLPLKVKAQADCAGEGQSPEEEVLALPLLSRNRVVGVMNVNKKKDGGVFTQGDLELLKILSTQAAALIENNNLFSSLRDAYIETIQTLVLLIEAKDPYTMGHSQRVTELALKIGSRIGLSSAWHEVLKYAGSLHDIGKIGVDGAILNKPGKLTGDEWEIIKKHPVIGSEVLKPVKFLTEVYPVVRSHHEHFDGTGYPDGLEGQEIPFLSRLLSVADAYDAMISTRAYRDSMTEEQVLQEIKRCSGSQFDPEIVHAFLKHFHDLVADL
jgi:putative nucleotidyltransferase with HDIG domain